MDFNCFIVVFEMAKSGSHMWLTFNTMREKNASFGQEIKFNINRYGRQRKFFKGKTSHVEAKLLCYAISASISSHSLSSSLSLSS